MSSLGPAIAGGTVGAVTGGLVAYLTAGFRVRRELAATEQHTGLRALRREARDVLRAERQFFPQDGAGNAAESTDPARVFQFATMAAARCHRAAVDLPAWRRALVRRRLVIVFGKDAVEAATAIPPEVPVGWTDRIPAKVADYIGQQRGAQMDRGAFQTAVEAPSLTAQQRL